MSPDKHLMAAGQSQERGRVIMETVSDLLFFIVGIASITAFVVALLVVRSSTRREPQVVVVNPQREDAGGGESVPLFVFVAAVVSVILFFS